MENYLKKFCFFLTFLGVNFMFLRPECLNYILLILHIKTLKITQNNIYFDNLRYETYYSSHSLRLPTMTM